jgi:lipid II:glycine glycyltransferase (peptidoglycan interpeptide bridge formation enzyme)
MKSITIPISDPAKWNSYILRSLDYDFYHCSSYHQLDSEKGAFLFVTEFKEDFIALPLLKREIEGTEYYDCTSVYGYAGPIYSKQYDLLDNRHIDIFQKSLYNYLIAQNIISVFSRLHPLIYQNSILSGLGEIVPLNKTVSIDLSLPIDEQRKQYRKSNKSEVNQLKRKGFFVKKANTDDEIDEFVDIYIETMQRVDAAQLYFFDRDYFHKFLRSEDFNAELLLAYQESVITAGAIFTTTKHIMQYHLAGTKSEFMKETPMKLILDEARLLGSDRGLKYLHLGGGVGGQDDDPLYRFKSGFSDLNFQFSVWKYIVNNDIYEQLVAKASSERSLSTGYFPRYRG